MKTQCFALAAMYVALFFSGIAFAQSSLQCQLDNYSNPGSGLNPVINISKDICRSRCGISFETALKQADGNGFLNLSKCPRGSGFRPLTNLHPPTGIVVGFDRTDPANEDFVLKLANAMLKLNTGVKLNIMIGGPKAVQKLSKLSKPPYSNFVNFVFGSTGGEWLRDPMVLGVSGKPPIPACRIS